MIDTVKEKLVTIADAPKEIPGRPHVATVRRWFDKAICGQKLETVLIGGRRYTSQEALQRFFERSTQASAGEEISTRSAGQRKQDIARAERKLTAAGI